MLDLENSKFASNMCEIEESTHQKEFRCQVDIELYKSEKMGIESRKKGNRQSLFRFVQKRRTFELEGKILYLIHRNC